MEGVSEATVFARGIEALPDTGVFATMKKVWADSERCRLEIEARQQRIEQNRTKLVELLGQAVAESVNRVEAMRIAYWHLDLPVKEIGRVFDCKVHAIPLMVGPLYLDGKCWDCRKERPLPYSSRSVLNTAFKNKKFAITPRCDDCDEKRARTEAQEVAVRVEEAKRESEGEQSWRRRFGELKRMTMRDYIQTPEWKGKREAALHRAQFRCQVCNNSKSLAVHLRDYARKAEERTSDLVVLCSSCLKVFLDNGAIVKED